MIAGKHYTVNNMLLAGFIAKQTEDTLAIELLNIKIQKVKNLTIRLHKF
jgi:hypothetical protein